MPSPSSSLATLRPDLAGSLEEFDLQADAQGFIATRVLPVIEVAKPVGNFGRIPIEQLLQRKQTKRAPGSAYGRGRFTFAPETFACQEHGWEEPVDHREAAMYAEYFDAERVAARRARWFVLESMESRVAGLVFNASRWTGASLTTAVDNEWDDWDDATPIADVEAAVQAVYAACGLWPNALICNRKVFRNVRNCDEIIDRLKYAGIDDPKAANLTTRTLAQVFDLEDIIVAGGTQNTANPGQAAALSPIWSDEYAMVARIARGPDIQEPGLGRTFHWGEDGSVIGAVVETYPDESIRGDWVRARMDTDEKILHTEAAHLLSNVTTIA